MKRVFVLLVAFLCFSGCKTFTEHSGVPSAGILVFDPDNLELLNALEEVPGARALCAAEDDDFFVSSTTGRLYRFNAGSMTLDTSFVIGPGASAGYGSMAYIPWKKSLYITGATGTILEVNTTDGTVRADISAGTSPAFITAAWNYAYVYVTDPLINRVHGIRTTTNAVQKTWSFNDSPSIVVSSSGGSDTLLIATTSPSRAYVQPTEYSSNPIPVSLENPSDMAGSGFLGVIYATHPRYHQSTGAVSVIDSLEPFSIRYQLTVPGDPVLVCSHSNGLVFFVLSTLTPGGFTLISYHAPFGTLLGSIDLPGYPVDMIMTGSRLVVLTY